MCALVSGCAGRYRTELVGHGTAIVQPRTDLGASRAPQPDDVVARSYAPWAAGGIQLAAGTYDLAMAFDVPRAQEIEWTVSCPGVQLSGTTGESLERYRERRLAELRLQVQRDRERTAAVTSAVVGAFAPRVTASHTTGPLAVRGDVGVDTDAVGEAVADSAISADVVLPIDDVGRGRLDTTVHVTTTGPGLCVVTAITDDANVYASYRVTRIRDLEAEARVAADAERSTAMSVRTQVRARLVAHGADAELRQRAARAAIEARYAVEAKAHADAELRVRVRAEQEEQWRITALHARAALRGRCEGHGADPRRRARIREEQRIAIEEHRVASEADARLELDLEQRRLELALAARASLRDRWTRFGAIPRPPMPELLAETPGAPPFEGAVWIAGKWVWTNGRWTWVAGGWTDPDVFAEVGGGEGGEVGEDGGPVIDDIGDFGLGVGVGVGAVREAVRDHRRPHPERERLRDHRTPTRDANIRDHRSSDHREIYTPSRSDPPPSRSDNKRDDESRGEDNKDDRGPMVRDHRR